MSDEIKRLGYLVGDFDYPFHPHHGFLKTYKAVSIGVRYFPKKNNSCCWGDKMWFVRANLCVPPPPGQWVKAHAQH